MKNVYVSDVENEHVRNEENQWVEILAMGNPYAGILMIWDQKLCAVAHEFGAAVKYEVIDSSKVGFYFSQLYNRVHKVVELLENSGLNCYRSFFNLDSYLKGLVESGSQDFEVLRNLPERVHRLSHELTDEIYREVIKK